MAVVKHGNRFTGEVTDVPPQKHSVRMDRVLTSKTPRLYDLGGLFQP